MIIEKEIKSNKWKYTIFFALLFILSITIIIQYPFIKNLLKQGILEGMPKWMVQGAAEQSDFNVYLSYNWFDKNLIQISVIFAILLGMSVISSEVEDHTLEFLLTRPLSRNNIFIQKTAIQLIISLLIIFTTTIILALISVIQNYDVNFIRLIIAIIPLYAKFLIIYGLSLLISLFLDDQVKSGLSTVLLLLIVWGISAIWNISALNLFSYAPISPYYINGMFPWVAVIKLYITAFLIYTLSLYKFRVKDF